MEITIAQATVLREALALAAAVIRGDVDGKRRCPWDNHDMKAEDGERVSPQLRTEESYTALMMDLDDRLSDIVKGIAR